MHHVASSSPILKFMNLRRLNQNECVKMSIRCISSKIVEKTAKVLAPTRNPVFRPVSMSTSAKSEPLVVVILGSTASGKSKLAIQLATHVPGEVISADSMQVYHGLDILTNKATKEEMKGIPHHMIGIVDRTEKFDVIKFRDAALPLVEKIIQEGKVPYIVGGTNYYIESLLWKVLIDEDQKEHSDSDNDNETNVASKKPKLIELETSDPILQYIRERGGYFTEQEVLEKWSPNELHEALLKVDPERAIKFHPHDQRKTVRSLQVFFRTGRKHSEIIEEQCHQSQIEEVGDGNVLSSDEDDTNLPQSLTGKLGGPLRFKNCICFWIQADRSILNARIEKRAHKMVGLGLQDELDSYIAEMNKENRTWDFQEGQLQSIGVKEFQSYIQLPVEDRQTEVGQKSFMEGLERLKIVTRQYAKRQVQWVQQRFLKSSRRQLPPVYGLDGNEIDEESWNRNIFSPALDILNAHVQGDVNLPLLKEKLLPVLVDDDAEEDFISRKCDVCDRIFVGSSQYNVHMKSAKHWKMVKRRRKQEERRKAMETKDHDACVVEMTT